MYLFLSPHYDDAIYSCGGLIHQLTQAGNNVLIFTIMAGEPQLPLPDTPVMADNHARWDAGENPVLARRDEDQIAAGIVGAQTLYNELADCIYRTQQGQPLYATEGSLWGDIHPKDPAVPELNSLGLVYGDAEIIYAPLGVGNHVDHQIVRNWALRMSGEYTIKFYEDYPYLRDEQAVQKAIQNFPRVMHLQETTLSEADLQVKVEAMTAYQSQISSFWPDADAIAQEVRATFTRDGKLVERVWCM